MKSIMLSVQPKWVEKIVSGEKTIEVRKTKPKLQTPFKVYIYCTKAHKPIVVDSSFLYYDDDLAIIHTPYGVEIRNPYGSLGKDDKLLNGKVIGEFICDNIIDFWCDKGFYLPTGKLKTDTCLTNTEFYDYGKGKPLYGLHISNLKIYDKPKELSEFKHRCDGNCKTDKKICIKVRQGRDDIWRDCDGFLQITRPPQSWQYIEV